MAVPAFYRGVIVHSIQALKIRVSILYDTREYIKARIIVLPDLFICIEGNASDLWDIL